MSHGLSSPTGRLNHALEPDSIVDLDGLFAEKNAIGDDVLNDLLPADVFCNPLAATVVPALQPQFPSEASEEPEVARTSIDARANLLDTHRLHGAVATANRLPAPPPRIQTEPQGDGLPAIGSVIDKYRVEELLGTGGFAAVYRATHLLLRVPVAVKLLLPKVIRAQPALAELLCEEARFTAQVSHPNVVRVMDVTHTPQLTYLVMEFVDGPSLATVIGKQKRLHPKDVVQIGIDVCNGLRSALEQGLIHRDIKPANILLTRGGSARIVDLGLARPATAPAATPGATSSLPKGAVVGTPLYMSPEQATQPEHVDFRSDIYSLGVTLYHAAVGAPPFTASSHIELIYKHQNAPVPPADRAVPGLSPDLSLLLTQMMAKDPASRPQSYDDVLESLHAVAAMLNANESSRNDAQSLGDSRLMKRIRQLFR